MMKLHLPFVFLIILSLILIGGGILFVPETYIHVIGLHLLLFSVALLFLWRKDLPTLVEDLGLKIGIMDLLKYVAVGFVLLFVGAFLAGLSASILLPEEKNTTPQIIQKLPWTLLVFAVIIAPVTEELFFRGLLCKRLGIPLSAITFGILHLTYGNIFQVVGTFAIGLVLGFLYTKSKSILPGMVVHGAYNASSVILVWALFSLII